jgi:hypothetical protein
MDRAGSTSAWTLLTGHGHVLVSIARNPSARVRDLAADAGLTERATQAIITDLVEANYVTRRRVGRRTVYTVDDRQHFRHPNQEGLLIGPFLALLTASPDEEGHLSDPDDAADPGNAESKA